MKMISEKVTSTLKLDKLVFDEINFKRINFSSNAKPAFSLKTEIRKHIDSDSFRVTLILDCSKEDEYTFSISLSGFFSFDSDIVDEKLKDDLVTKNAVAILMPYMRSQVSLLTAQPNVDCIVLPPFNINAILDENKK